MPVGEPPPYVASTTSSPVPAGFTDLATIPGLRFHVAYATADNFTGAPLPGYGWPGAWLAAPAAAALGRAATALAAQDLALVVFDGYRPARASAAMVAWAERVGRTDLLGVYIARRSEPDRNSRTESAEAHPDAGRVPAEGAGPRPVTEAGARPAPEASSGRREGFPVRLSGHNDGGSVDVGLADLTTGAFLDMGSPFDTFDATAHVANARGDTRRRRAQLGDAMAAVGWEPYSMEWWHFRFTAWQGPARDVPYGAAERPEPGEVGR